MVLYRPGINKFCFVSWIFYRWTLIPNRKNATVTHSHIVSGMFRVSDFDSSFFFLHSPFISISISNYICILWVVYWCCWPFRHFFLLLLLHSQNHFSKCIRVSWTLRHIGLVVDNKNEFHVFVRSVFLSYFRLFVLFCLYLDATSGNSFSFLWIWQSNNSTDDLSQVGFFFPPCTFNTFWESVVNCFQF